MSRKVVSLCLFSSSPGERRRRLGHANRRRRQHGEVQDRPCESIALERQPGSGVRVEFMLRPDADELREARGDSSNHSGGDRVSSVLQHNSVAFHAMSERSFAVP